MAWENVVEAVAAGTGASVSVAVLARKWFRNAVQGVVDDSIANVLRKQERQDRKLERIERKLDNLNGHGGS